ncbi:precorrin-3B synthase [Beijerinckia sp. L45]|uniref:precorrin-3B synthase n=1 Tax=Beijerinckia sp. L45 TaxID=1641855 RepID=UPI00131D8053|nr:precorrin-3B synthase [Beijerinckia sp. L45]
MSALRKGWCPGALRPMMARDGLLVRLRLTGGRLTSEVARALAALSDYYGNGLFDLSARANLQLRGVDQADLPSLLAALDDLDLIDADPDGEAVRNVMASPLAGLGARRDIAPIVTALEAMLAQDAALHALPNKFGFLVDDGGAPTLAGVSADVRFDVMPEAPDRVWIGLGGTRDHAVSLGFCAPDQVVEAAAHIAHTFLSLAAGHEPPIRRMKMLIERLGAYQTARAFGVEGEMARPEYSGAIFNRPPVGFFSSDDVDVLGLAVPFGRFDHRMLRCVADLADTHGRGALRLTPWRCFLVPGIAGSVDLGALRTQTFIVDPEDPALRIAACVGMAGCERGTTSTHADAAHLVEAATRIGGAAISIHVSGCEKGCAKASRTAFTLVGHDGVYDLVAGGKAGDVPTRRDLDLAAIEAALAAKVLA